MQATAVLITRQVTAMVASADFTPGAGDESTIALFINNITPNRNSVVEDLDLATFAGSTPKACAAGAAGKAINPVTGQWEIRPKEPAGGFEFITTDTANLPQTVYGAVLLNGDGELQAWELFDMPIVLNAANQRVDVAQPKLVLPLDPFS